MRAERCTLSEARLYFIISYMKHQQKQIFFPLMSLCEIKNRKSIKTSSFIQSSPNFFAFSRRKSHLNYHFLNVIICEPSVKEEKHLLFNFLPRINFFFAVFSLKMAGQILHIFFPAAVERKGKKQIQRETWEKCKNR